MRDFTDVKPKKLKTGSRRALDRRAEKEGSGPQDGSRGTLRMLDALFKIHWLLRRPGAIASMERFKDELGASERTVRRYFEYICDRFGVAIAHDRDHGGYRYAGDPVEISTAMLDEDDLSSLYVASPLLAQYRGTTLGPKFDRSFGKIAAQLPSSVRSRVEKGPARVQAKARAPVKEDPQRFATVSEAIARERQLDLTYFSAHSGTTSTRTVHPYGLCTVNARWYLLAFDPSRNRVLKFAVERIWTAALNKKKFDRPQDFNISEYLKNAFGIYEAPAEERAETTEIRVKFDALAARYVKDTIWHGSQRTLELEGGGVELSFEVRGTVELEAFILSWGEHAEVVGPPALRERLLARLRGALSKYSASG